MFGKISRTFLQGQGFNIASRQNYWHSLLCTSPKDKNEENKMHVLKITLRRLLVFFQNQ